MAVSYNKCNGSSPAAEQSTEVMLKRLFLVLFLGVSAIAVSAERAPAKVVATIGGDDVYSLLPVGKIPAVDNPEYLSGEEANAQMKPEEPVLGLVVGDAARAYSLWQLDAHEIVNDTFEGRPIAATW